MADLLLSMLGAVAQFERELIKERQREELQSLKLRAMYTGAECQA